MVSSSAAAREIEYFVLPGRSNPWLLARVRWPDVFQAISAAEPDWRSDPGLFDLPYDPSSVAVSIQVAAAIAVEWGAELPSADEGPVPGPVLIRRMPANWSELSPAAKRAWSIETGPAKGATDGTPRSRRWRRRRATSGTESDHRDRADDELIVLLDAELRAVIDLTDSAPAALTKGEDS